MSRKRYSSGSRGGSPYWGPLNSTSPQQANYEDSLTAECLIRTFMEKGNMDDPILKTLFIGGSKPREDETEEDLLFRRMKNSWLEKKGRNYGLKEYLKVKMKECQIGTDFDGRWAKYSIMKAPLIITPKIWINKRGEEKRFLKDFQLDIFRNEQYLSECAVRIEKKGYPNSIIEMIDERLVIHRWDQFPDKEPVIREKENWRKTFHIIKDDLDVYHHVILQRYQMDMLNAFYEDQNRGSIQLVQQDWSSFICLARGKKKLMTTLKPKIKSRNSSRDKMQGNEEPLKIEQRLADQSVIEERLSDQESQKSQEVRRKLRIEQQGSTVLLSISQAQRELKDLEQIEKTLSLAQLNDGDTDKDLYPKDLFPDGLIKFAQEHGVNNFLRLFLKLNYEWVTSGRLSDGTRYHRELYEAMANIRDEILSADKTFMKAETETQFDNFTKDYYGILDAFFIGSELIVYVSEQLVCKMVEIRKLRYNAIDRYFKIIRKPQEEMGIIISFYQKVIRNYGLGRLSLCDIHAICPLCVSVQKRQDIMKHPCTAASVDLAIRGRSQ